MTSTTIDSIVNLLEDFQKAQRIEAERKRINQLTGDELLEELQSLVTLTEHSDPRNTIT